MADFDYLKKPISNWTENELRHAQAHIGSPVNVNLREAIDAKLEAIEANQRLVRVRSRAQKEKRLSLSFVDKTSKPAKSVDYISVKQSVQDASTKKGGGPALSVAMVVGAYDWICGHPELTALLPKLPSLVWLSLVVAGLGWWLILFVIRLSEKWDEKH